jgi:hypothetical protein
MYHRLLVNLFGGSIMQQPPNQRPSQPQWQPLPPQQQYSQYPPQPEQYQQPPQLQQPQMQPSPKVRPPKKQSPWAWLIGGLLVGTIFGYAIHVPGASSPTPSTTSTTPVTQATSQAPTQAAVTPTPTHAPKWTTFQTFNGSGSKHTATFTAPADWKILWTCNPTSFAIPYNVIIEVDNASDGSTLDLPVNTTCKAGNTSDSSEEHQGGSVFLNVTSEGDWTIQVQELK